MKKITSFLTSAVIISTILINGSGVASASGGFVKRTSNITGVGSVTNPIKFDKYLTSALAPAKEYTVSQTVTRGSTITGNITSEGIKNLKLQFSYGKTTSTSDMIGTVISANPKKNSKLGLKIKYKEQNYKENVTDEYWYSNSGTSYIKYSNSGKYSIPVDKYIFVQYQ
ncbi:hypothetical protein [Gottfriedia acidiceleris]|uniref:Uncharacterized protein n=1 Tax=Gottfriedia acidiceleris TaxID=371036 RepID=A0ABY4JNR4_9BACI|nr:hypothetical protein [Gottfriedia acidiceleris]UPM55485.1 hypothetical protein MY490_06485 [Gottfriedia acidiceleris]